jgi:hypothetical protein
VTLNEYEFPEKKVVNVHSQLTKLVEKNYYLNKSARDAYRSYLLAYASHSHKEIFNVHELDLQVRRKGGDLKYASKWDEVLILWLLWCLCAWSGGGPWLRLLRAPACGPELQCQGR